jgi:probable phosphoglycerate mutase
VLLVRHAEAHNPAAVLYGRLPRVRLSDAGRRQAQRLADLLAAEPVAAIWCSPLLRARQTAAAIAARHPALRFRVSHLLHEIRTGWQGRSHLELDAIGFNFYDHPLSSDDETIAAVWDRVRRFVERERARHPGRTVVAVSHGDPILIAVAGYLGRPLRAAAIRPDRYPATGAFYRLVFAPGAARPEVLYEEPETGLARREA